ncbi:MAG: hypothetical protein ABSF98_21200 [Bryobacteraceae bacterium]|jgi:hypothetical protein
MARKPWFQQNSTVLYRRRRKNRGIAGCWFNLEQERTRSRLSGFGYGEFIRLRDEFGNIWRGSAEEGPDDTVRYRFRDALGRSVTGVSDTWGLVLRDERGKTWRGFVE